MEYAATIARSLLEIFGPIIALTLGPLIAAAAWKLIQKTGLDTEALNRETFQTAISNAALEAVRRAGGPAVAARIDNVHLLPAVQQALRGAPDAIKALKVSPEEVERRVLAQATAIVQSTPVSDTPLSTEGGAIAPSRHAHIDAMLARMVGK